jgi:hypothetical protein
MALRWAAYSGAWQMGAGHQQGGGRGHKFFVDVGFAQALSAQLSR